MLLLLHSRSHLRSDINMQDSIQLHGLRIADFAFAPRQDIRLQPFSGSVWRGAFGHSLKRMVCVMRLRPCDGCPLAATCIYPSFFGGEGEADHARPYVLAPERSPHGGVLAAGARFTVRLTLLPAAAAAAPYVAHALVEAARAGLSSRRVPFDCIGVSPAGAPSSEAEPAASEDDPFGPPLSAAPPPAPAQVGLRFASPLRLRLQGDLVTGRTLRPGHLASAALRRLRMIGLGAPTSFGEAARAEAASVTFQDAQLGWLETTRFSTRQNTAMQLGGIVGEATLSLSTAPHLWQLLWAASLVHLGKGASMGFGRIELHAA